MEIHYEDMRGDPAAAMRTMFGFAGIPFDEPLLERISADTDLSSYDESVRRSGFRGGGQGGGWRNEFTMAEALGFRRAAGELLIDLGYETDGSWWRGLAGNGRRWPGRRVSRPAASGSAG
jgi:hypothetical protein